MAKRLEEYERLLRDLILRVDEKDQRLIRKAVEHVRYQSWVWKRFDNSAHGKVGVCLRG